MKEACDVDYANSLKHYGPLTTLYYRKGKMQAMNEVLELLQTGKLPEGYQNES